MKRFSLDASRLPLVAFLLVLVVAPVGISHAQSFSLGADIVSRYVWRGTDFGESASIQPGLAFTTGGLEIGTWASYAVDPSSAGANEHDLYVSYTKGPVSFGVTDYYFPAPGGAGFFNFEGDGAGAHWIEPFVSFAGSETFPISLYAGLFAHNDPDNSLYLEAAYPFAIDGTELSVKTAVVPMESAFYGTDGPGIVTLGLSATRVLPITDSFSLPVSVSYIMNPESERTFLVFGVTL